MAQDVEPARIGIPGGNDILGANAVVPQQIVPPLVLAVYVGSVAQGLMPSWWVVAFSGLMSLRRIPVLPS